MKQIADFGNGWITSIYFIDDQTGFVALYGRTNGCILRTTNGGLNWTACGTPLLSSPAQVTDIWFNTAQDGWATLFYGIAPGNSQSLWHTTDGGVIWTTINFPASNTAAVRQTS